MQKAIEFEVERHIKTLEAGGRLVQETRLWDERLSETRPMRSKEEAHDYRYFPEPDLPPLEVPNALVDTARAQLPELPRPKLKRFQSQYGLSAYDAKILVAERALADWYEAAAKDYPDFKKLSNWIQGELLRFFKEE